MRNITVGPKFDVDSKRDVFLFLGDCGGKHIKVEITRQAISDHYGSEDSMEAASELINENRQDVNAVIIRALKETRLSSNDDSIQINYQYFSQLIRKT